MDRKKRPEQPCWITSGLFDGMFEVQEAVGQIDYVKKSVRTHAEADPELVSRLEALEGRVEQLARELAAWAKNWQTFQEAGTRDREHLYQVVLSLKKEWEAGRDEHRDH